MVWFLIALAVGLGVLWYFYRNKDTDAPFTVDTFKKEVKEEAVEVQAKVEAALDVNKDGKVDVADAKAAVKKVKAGAKKAAGKAKTAAKKIKVAK